MSRVLAERGCRVTGVDVSEGAAEIAKRFCRRVVIADLDAVELGRHLHGEDFDVILCADILEHLRHPESVLAELGSFVRSEGFLVASVPNVSHVSVVADLLEGQFRYRTDGLLDESHLRFFALDSLYELFESTGWLVSHLDRILLEPELTELRTDLSRFEPKVIEALTSHPESKTYQFIVRAHFGRNARGSERLESLVDSEQPGVSVVASFLKHEAMDPVFSRMRFLEDDRVWRTKEIERLRRELAELTHHLEAVQRDARSRIEALEDERTRTTAELETTNRMLENIRRSRAYRVASVLGRLRAKILPRR